MSERRCRHKALFEQDRPQQRKWMPTEHGRFVTVQANGKVDLEVDGVFSFSVKDGFDRDTVRIGTGRAETTFSVNIEVLYTFADFEHGEPELVQIEVVPTTIEVDFGEVGPDYES